MDLADSLRKTYAQKNHCRKVLILALTLAPPLLFSYGCIGLAGGKSAVQANVQGAFQVSPSTVNFGNVPVGKAASQSVSVANMGNSAINITQASLSNPQFALSGLSIPMALPVGQAGTFSVSVNPTTSGNVTGTLTVHGDSGSSPVIVNLSATAVSAQPQVSLSSNSVDLGTVGIGSQNTASVVISNAGGADLTISMITLNGATFSVSGVATPKTISSGQSATLNVSFRPTVAGAVTGSVAITSNDPATPTASIALTGTGSSTPVGQLSASSPSVSFGNVATGSTATQQLTLSNTGNASTQISGVTVSGAGFSVTGVTSSSTVSASQTLPISVSFAPSAAGSVSGTLTITSNANGSPLKIPLTGTGVQPGLSVAPTSFNFGSIVDGQNKSQTFTLTNTGSGTLTVAQLSVSGAGYSVSGLSTPANIAAGQSTTFSAEFAPNTAGTLTGSITIASNAPNSPAGVALSGTGVAASVTMTPTPASVSFGNINAGSSNTQSVTLTNNGNSSLTISQVSSTVRDVKTSGISTPMTLAAGKQASLTVTFAPSASENVTGNVTVTSSQGASAVIPVSGSGVQPALSLTPSSINFGSLSVGSSNSQTIRVRNSGTGTLTISQVNVSGAGFSSSGLSLPISLSAGQSSTFNLQFAPSSAGSATGSASIVSNAPGSPASVALSGTATSASQTLSFSTTSLNFGNVNDGSSVSQSVTLTDTGNAGVTVSQISVSGTGFALSGAGTPVTLTPSQTLTFGVVFNPVSAGSASGHVTVASNAAGSPVTITLSGTGVSTAAHSVAMTWNASTSTVSGYNVYRSTTSGGGYVLINSGLVLGLSYTDSSVQNGTTYYYVTTAVDSSGDESSYSNEAQAVIP